MFCLIHDGHCRNLHPWVQGRQSSVRGSRRGHRHRGAPRACRARPPGAPARASERSLLSRNAAEHPEIGAWLFVFHLFGRVISLYAPLLLSLPSQVGTGQLSQSLPIRGKTMKTLLGIFFSPCPLDSLKKVKKKSSSVGEG